MTNALEHEAAIADEADAIRKAYGGDQITFDLFTSLWPLLRRPIPAGYITDTPATKGKPYASTGIHSVQVQIDRMNNVLTPVWWWDTTEYEDEGRLCRVQVMVGNRGCGPLVVRSSWGGVNQGSTKGNIYKGSYTNAAKRAFAALGVGHEVYVGSVDPDPDVNPDVAAAGATDEAATIGATIAGKLVKRVWAAGVEDKLQLAASHVADRDVGDCSTQGKATAALKSLTYPQAERLDHWLTGKEGSDDE